MRRSQHAALTCATHMRRARTENPESDSNRPPRTGNPRERRSHAPLTRAALMRCAHMRRSRALLDGAVVRLGVVRERRRERRRVRGAGDRLRRRQAARDVAEAGVAVDAAGGGARLEGPRARARRVGGRRALAAEGGVLRELLDLVVVPLTGLGGARLARAGAEGVGGPTHLVTVDAGAGGGVARAAVGLARRLDPEERVDDGRDGCVRRGQVARALAARVAPVRATRARVGHAVAPGVDDVVGGELGDGALQLLCEGLHVVVFILAIVVLGDEPARVRAAAAAASGAVGVHVLVKGGRGTRRAEGLVVGDVGGEATDETIDLEQLHEGRECLRVVGPAKPAAVRRVHVQRGRRRERSQLVDGVGDAFVVRGARRGVAALGVVVVRHEVGQRVGLHDQHHRHLALVLGQHGRDRVDKVALILLEPRRALTRRRAVAVAGGVVGAADLADGVEGVAVAVGQVVHHDRHQRCGRLLGGVGEHAVERVGR
mmetsp:Transcript_52143/g.153915  ORF Transcript_52143/g.153915 Transcript_52143/m.153915 type:complete len:487 (-) Transcript_52143:221-1681(-)